MSLAGLLADCYADPGLFHEAVLGRKPFYPKQEAIAASCATHRYTVVPTAHALGKTWMAPSIALWWLMTRPGSLVVTTSPSNTQLVNALWGGMRAAYRNARFPLPGEISEGAATPQTLRLGPRWYAIGWAAKKPESFQGQRPDDGELLVIVDESSGVEQPIWDAIESLGADSHLILGNPIRSRGHFRALYDLAEAGAPGYRAFNLSAFDSPYADLTDDQVRARGLPKGLATGSWIERMRRLYGEASLFWRTRVLARFPDEDLDQLIPPAWADRCYLAPRVEGPGGIRGLSLDVAKGTGRDGTVAMVGDRLGLLACHRDNRTDLVGAAQLGAKLSRDWGVAHDRIVYDAGGWAGTELARHLAALGVTTAVPFFGGAKQKGLYRDRKTAGAWKLRQRLDPERPELLAPPPAPVNRGWTLLDHGRIPEPDRARLPAHYAIPPGVIGPQWDDLRQELTEFRYSNDGRQIALEKKEDLVERLGRSPDLADTLIMLHYLLGPA